MTFLHYWRWHTRLPERFGQQSLWPPIPPTLHRTLPRDAPETPRSTLDPDRGYYGESPVRLRRYERAVGGRRSSHSTENSEEPNKRLDLCLKTAPISSRMAKLP